MPALAANLRVIDKAIKGQAAVYAITGHPGLYLDVRGQGRATWRLRYRPKPNTNQRWFRLGSHASADQFAAIAAQALTLMNDLRLKGIDPADRPSAEPAIPVAHTPDRTLSACFPHWLDYTGKRRPRPLSPATRQTYLGLFHLHVEPLLGHLEFKSLDRATIQRALATIKANTTDPARDAPVADDEPARVQRRGLQATKALAILHSMCEWALDQDWIDRNPCRGISDPVPVANPEGKQHRPPTDSELRQLWQRAPKTLTPAQTRVLKLAILSGRRISEIVGIMPEEVHVDDAIPYVYFPANRAGNKSKQEDAMPLAPLALALMKDALAASVPGQPLFQGAASRWTTSKALTLLRREWDWPDPPVRFHDFRTLINGQMAKLRIPSELRSRTLHHTGDIREFVNTVYSAYDHMPERLHALDLWEQRLQEIVFDRPASGLKWT